MEICCGRVRRGFRVVQRQAPVTRGPQHIPVSDLRCKVKSRYLEGLSLLALCGVEMRRGGVGTAYRLPALSSAGASLASPCFRFHIPLIEPDGRISRFRLSEKGSRCRPREMARPPAKADETQHVV